MPAGPGETLLSTHFADVHYYFGDPSSFPAHHRFTRGSYVYLFHNATNQQAKLEVANHAGTPNQDAFHGYLTAVRVQYNHLQPTLVSLAIDSDAVPDHSTWHLNSYDERNEQKYTYKLHTVDLYLWTEKDASTFVTHLKKSVSPDRLDIKNAPARSTPHAEHRDSMSPVVQQLERTAIGTPYQQRTSSTVSAQSFPGPPTEAPPASTSTHTPQAAPMAYNPAAPAAPEPISYREKTPPPPDGGSGTGLSNAAKYDHAPAQPQQYSFSPGQYQTSNQTTPQHAYFSGPPQQQDQQPSSQASFPGPPSSMPPPPQSARAPSFGPLAQSTLPQSPPPGQQTFQRASSFGGPPGQTQYANYNSQSNYNQPGAPGYNPQLPPTPSAPPAYHGHTPMQSPALPPPPPISHQQHAPPPGGYSDFNYANAQAQPNASNAYSGYSGDVHGQAYRPTEAEHAAHGAHAKPKRQNTGGVAGNVESKVGKYLNKLDKLW